METTFLHPLFKAEIRSLIRDEQRAALLEFFNDKQPHQQPEPEPEQTFSIPGLADYLKCTKATIHAYKNRNVFPYYQTGRTVYFKKSEVDAALSANKKGLKNG